ncbi:hypothetical protein Pla52n_51900 [Stieleria varia]|uniref:SLA1 homology domain-containing protein n=2 Tax=Stieleria varia TaxID=2528005 RepID=A0A5C6AKI0_9BACT|nr:hypothetical protein Pla52n_51900 [Stieleria varia]
MDGQTVACEACGKEFVVKSGVGLISGFDLVSDAAEQTPVASANPPLESNPFAEIDTPLMPDLEEALRQSELNARPFVSSPATNFAYPSDERDLLEISLDNDSSIETKTLQSRLPLIIGALVAFLMIGLVVLAILFVRSLGIGSQTSREAMAGGGDATASLDDFADNFRQFRRGHELGSIEYSNVHPGPVCWSGVFYSCNKFGVLRFALPKSCPVDIVFLSAQEAIPQWMELKPGASVTFTANLTPRVHYAIHWGANVVPNEFKYESNGLTDGTGRLDEKAGYQGRDQVQAKLIVNELRLASAKPLSEIQNAKAFAEHWVALDLGTLEMNEDGEITGFSAASTQRQNFIPNLPASEQVSTNLTDDALAMICLLPELSHLTVISSNLTSQAMKEIAKCKKLRTLSFMGTEFSNEDVLKISKCDSLSILSIDGKGITDEAIPTLLAMPNLKNVFLTESGMTKEGLATLRKTLHERVFGEESKDSTTDASADAEVGQVPQAEMYQSLETAPSIEKSTEAPEKQPTNDNVELTEDDNWRTFRSRNGKYEKEARFLKLIGDTVHLRTRDGQEISLAIGLLSDDDQLYISRALKSR